MQTQTTTNDQLINVLESDVHSWNRPRTDKELRDFIAARHDRLSDTLLFE